MIQGTQGVGKTNLLNFFESEIRDALNEGEGYYVVRYLADPEASFDGIIRRLFQELGIEHLEKLAQYLKEDSAAITVVRNEDMRNALLRLSKGAPSELFLEWILGFRLLKGRREALGVHFKLDTVESKTAALRDLVCE